MEALHFQAVILYVVISQCSILETESSQSVDCWWTGCQLNSWEITGCEQYNRTQLNIESCEDGNKFFCCVGDSAQTESLSTTTLGHYTNCVWSECQPSEWPDRGCPSGAVQVSSESCGQDKGDTFQCCEQEQDSNVDDGFNSVTGESFEDFVKYLLLKGKNFTLEPDSLPCVDVDTEKQSILKIKKEGIYICDLCPFFPQKRFVNVFLSNEPYKTEFNLKFAECFGFCFDKNDCVALSYDYSDNTCYVFNNTVGTLVQGARWSTVFMTQPTGVLQDWTYSRHTSITGQVLSSLKSEGFKSCLKSCNQMNRCNYVSYFLKTGECVMFSSKRNIEYIDLEYGAISAFKLSSVDGVDVTARFIEVGDDIFNTPEDLVGKKDECSSERNETHSAFFSRSCSTSPGVGCDTATGCKKCYYPESTNDRHNLVICPDSKWIVFNEIKEYIRRSLEKCLNNSLCVAVGYDLNKREATQLTFDSLLGVEFTTMFILRYPIKKSKNHNIVSEFDFLLKYDIERIGNVSEEFKVSSGKTFESCLNIFKSRTSYRSMSYVDGICKVSSEEVKYIFRDGNFITVLKKADITSPVQNYARTPEISIDKDLAKRVLDSCNNCVEDCAKKCNEDFKDWCSHFTVKKSSKTAYCYFFDFFNDTVAYSIETTQKGNTELFTKLSTLDFTLKSLNDLNSFQSSDIYNCFQSDSENQQTSTSLTTYEWTDNRNTAIQLRKKRGFFDFIGNALKSVGDFVVDTVKSTVDDVVDTAGGVVKSIKHVVEGDFESAKESFVNIPIVKDVQTAVDFGKAVVAGDWDEVKDKGLDLLQSHALDIATSFIPLGGKFIGKGLKFIGKAAKKLGNKAKRAAKHNIKKISNNSKKINTKNKKKKKKEDHDGKDKEDKRRNNCQKRSKRAAGKRRRPGNCDDDEDEEEDERNSCPPVRILDVIESTMSGCRNRKNNAQCKFECRPGFNEPSRDVKCIGKGKKRPDWTPKPTCEKITCGKSLKPTITLQTPHINTWGSTTFGKFITVYFVVYNKRRKLPDYSVALHQSTQYFSKDYTALKNVKRSGVFVPFPCPELVNHQAKPSDYALSGWDQGHLTPANIARWSEKARLSSNLFINVAPQDPFTNQGPWKRLETGVENFSKKERSIVATGICSKSIGKTKVGGIDVPTCYWKMVCYRSNNVNETGVEHVVGFLTSNSHPLNREERRREVYTLYSQAELRKELKTRFSHTLASPWKVSAVAINIGRPVELLSYVWYPVNRFGCETANDLPDEERKKWMEKLPKGKTTCKIGGRKKRDGMIENLSGCTPNSRTKTGGKKSVVLGVLSGDASSSSIDDEGEESSLLEEDGDALVSVQKCNKRIIGYYTSWGEKKISGRELKRLTHVVYAFLEMKEDGSVDVGSADRSHAVNIEEETRKSKERLTNLMELANLYSHVKVMFAVGGWENSQYFSAVAANPSKRITFITSIVKMIQKYGFDGIDIDWEYPVTGGANEGIPQDKQNYVNLMREIRSTLDGLAEEAGRTDKFLISFAGAAGQWTLDPGFDLPGLLKYADFVNIMTYDYFGAWTSKWGAYTGPPAPLYFGMPASFSGKTNADWTVKYYTCKTKLPHKINMGVPFYGRFWKNVGNTVGGDDGMWRKAEQVNGKFEGGYVPWNNISTFLDEGGFEKRFHEKSKTPYAWNPGSKTFLGYENKKSLEFKAKYAAEKNVGGVMIWSVELDDDDLTLLNTVYRASLCSKTRSNEINYKCPPIDEKRWWTSEDGDEVAGLCGRSAPLYKGYYPVCDPDDPGYSCCGPAGYCGSEAEYCDCPTCKDYGKYPEKILEAPIKPSVPVSWYFLNADRGKRGRCGRKIPKIQDVFPTCNPDDNNAFCCSPAGFCGSTSEYCDCDGCINFKKNKNYRYGPKKWWDQEDGEDKAGKCGPNAPKVDGIYEAECEPNTKFSCCSDSGFCGSGPEYCDCAGCKKFT